MGNGGHTRQRRWGTLLLCLALLCAGLAHAGVALAGQAFTLQKLPGDAAPADVLSGRLDDRLEPAAAMVIQGRRGEVDWWRITTPAPLSAEGQPQLLLRAPFLDRVQSWVPGRDGPATHTLYGEHADFSHSSRALVLDLPEGIPAGEAVWLRVESASRMRMPVSIEPMDDVREQDLKHVAWRVFVLTVLVVLALLAFAFRSGTGDSAFAWFGAMLCCGALYLVSVGGDARMLPLGELMFGESFRGHRAVGGLGVICSNRFQRLYLDLPGRMPLLDRLLGVGTLLAAVSAVGSLFLDAAWLAHCGNSGLMLSAMVLLVASVALALRGERAGRVVVLSWLPLMVFTTLVASEMMGWWPGRPWLAQGLAASFAVAGLLLTIGLADKVLELRRDRDHASARASRDDLTGLFNRAGLDAELQQAMQAATAHGTPLSIAFVDVDHFKAINDRYGHSIGDQCLRIVSMRIRNQLRVGDVLGRYGGDEFLVVLPGSPLQEALAAADRMLASVNGRPLSISDVRFDGSLSIGVAEFIVGESAESLFERADAALYASKQDGRNRVSGAHHHWEAVSA